MGVNKRISKIVQDTIFTRDLYLREYSPVDDSTFPLSNPILDRFCSKILPEIGHKIETLYLKGTWTERVFHATNCPNLINLGLCDIQFEQLTMFLFCGTPLLKKEFNRSFEKPLPTLRIFSLWCKDKICNFEKSVVPRLRRMLNLEELHLNIIVRCYEKLIDGETLKKDIVIYMPHLYKFTFNICSIIYHRNQTNFPLNEHIQKTFQYFPNNEIITCIDHFQEKAYSQCHIYSYPYKWEVYNNITNNFRGGLFMSVTKVLLYDEHSFEYEVFLRISKSFPFMRELTINNRKAQNKKQFIKSNNDDQILPIIEYPNLQRLDVSDTHDDYVELFLFDTKIFLPNDLHICTHYQSLKTVTYYFTRYTTGSNCVKLAALYVDEMDRINEHIKNYFPDICIREAIDFELFK
ncbi:unnamed protein product [Rotaria socialis]|uniref:Uncharacterized protein n=1 Tax=Rotaria socialis TaxID=392032 RepID=A0A820GV10_9BILA|nr:unnamed protein product [Rotaria socialis]